MSDLIFIFYGLFGSMFFGITAVIIRNGVIGQDIFYGILIRVAGSFPFLLLFSVLISGTSFINNLLDVKILLLTFGSAILLITGDILLMKILKTKSVGSIIPIIASNPIITLLLLDFYDYAEVTLRSIILTGFIILGIMMITYSTGDGISFDFESLVYGLLISLVWGVMLFLEIVTLSQDGVTGYTYSTNKVMFLGIMAIFFLIFRSVQGVSIRSLYHLQSNRSTKFMLLGGFTGWTAGVLLVYTAFERGPAEIITPIVGMNPMFAIGVSIILGQEDLNRTKIIGMLLSIICSVLLVI